MKKIFALLIFLMAITTYAKPKDHFPITMPTVSTGVKAEEPQTQCPGCTTMAGLANGIPIGITVASDGTVNAGTTSSTAQTPCNFCTVAAGLFNGIPVALKVDANGNLQTSASGGGTVSSIATTGPITGGPITTTGTIACPTCVASAAALTSNAVVIGGGLQASSTISADTTTTHALFATAGAPAFRALAAADIPTLIPIANIGSAGLSGTGPIAISAAGAISCSTCNTTSANVISVSGDGTLFTNSASTGAVTLTLGTTNGTGNFVRTTSPTFVTPTLGAAVATTYNGITFSTSSGTFTLTNAKTFAVTNTLTLSGTDGTVMTFPTTTATIARTDASNTFTGHQTIEGVTSTGATGTGAFVFATTPTLVTPVLGAATGTSLNLTGWTVNSSGLVTKYNGNSTAGNGQPYIAGTLSGVNQTATVGSQNLSASVPAGLYTIHFYLDQSGTCTTVATGQLVAVFGWTDGTHARTQTTTFIPLPGDTGATQYSFGPFDIHAAVSTAVTVTLTYTACSVGGPWAYDYDIKLIAN